MPTTTKMTIAAQVESARVLLENVLRDHEIRQALETVGYTPAMLQSGTMVLEAAVQAVTRKGKVGGGKLGRSTEQHGAQRDLRRAYQDCVDRIRLAAEADPTLLVQLEIQGHTPNALAELLLRVERLLQVVAQEAGIRSLLAERGVDAARLTELKDLMAALKTAENAQEAAKGEALAATRAQQDALETLAAYVTPLRQAVRVACKGRPDLLRVVGM